MWVLNWNEPRDDQIDSCVFLLLNVCVCGDVKTGVMKNTSISVFGERNESGVFVCGMEGEG